MATYRPRPGKPLLRPYTVLVLDGIVFAVHRWGHEPDLREYERAHEAAEVVGLPIFVYEVDRRLPPPPAPMSPVDPVALQWVEVEHYQPMLMA